MRAVLITWPALLQTGGWGAVSVSEATPPLGPPWPLKGAEPPAVTLQNFVSFMSCIEMRLLRRLEVRRVRSPVRDPARAVQPRPLSPAAAGSRRLGEQRGADRPTLPNRQGAPRGRTDLPYGAPFRQDVLGPSEG